MFTAMQLIGLALVIVGAFLAAGVPGAIVGAGVTLTYFGLAGER
jgi:hypothetical protein